MAFCSAKCRLDVAFPVLKGGFPFGIALEKDQRGVDCQFHCQIPFADVPLVEGLLIHNFRPRVPGNPSGRGRGV